MHFTDGYVHVYVIVQHLHFELGTILSVELNIRLLFLWTLHLFPKNSISLLCIEAPFQAFFGGKPFAAY